MSQSQGGRLLGPGTRLPPPPPPGPPGPLSYQGSMATSHTKGARLGQSLNPRFVAWCIMVTPGIGFDFRFCSLCWGPPRMQG